ncbi:hypothetical protein NQZ68_029789 [Dissostichus eleginoides]|nr:hypothetical protein NQZ68_029789 [Dissostichus eleginoides]
MKSQSRQQIPVGVMTSGDMLLSPNKERGGGGGGRRAIDRPDACYPEPPLGAPPSENQSQGPVTLTRWL